MEVASFALRCRRCCLLRFIHSSSQLCQQEVLTHYYFLSLPSSRSRRVYYITYNPKTDGDYRLAYYEDKRKAFPPDIERIPGKDYSAGGKVYNVGNPIPTKGM